MPTEVTWRSGSPDTNAHVIQRSGSGFPTNRVRRCKSAKNSSTVSFCRSHHVVNSLNALKSSIAYAVNRALFISSGSVLSSWLSCRYTVRATPGSHNGSTGSTLYIADNSQTISTCSSHSTIGISVTAPLNSGINRISNALPDMVDERVKAEIAWVEIDYGIRLSRVEYLNFQLSFSFDRSVLYVFFSTCRSITCYLWKDLYEFWSLLIFLIFHPAILVGMLM